MSGAAIASNIRLWDIWGIEQDTFQSEDFVKILQGQVQNGASMQDQNTSALLRIFASSAARNIHVVLFFMPAADVDNPNKEANNLKRFIQLAKDHGELYSAAPTARYSHFFRNSVRSCFVNV
jgi:hypothetical protein